jgi:hypothetical protein
MVFFKTSYPLDPNVLRKRYVYGSFPLAYSQQMVKPPSEWCNTGGLVTLSGG